MEDKHNYEVFNAYLKIIHNRINAALNDLDKFENSFNAMKNCNYHAEIDIQPTFRQTFGSKDEIKRKLTTSFTINKDKK